MKTSKNVQLLQKLFTFIHPERVDEIAKETGFIKRKRLVTANDFLSLIFQLQGNLVDYSIQELCAKLCSEQDILISRAAVDKKFTPEAVLFLQRLVHEFLREHQQLEFSVLSLLETWPFTSIRVLDSTTVSVPDHLKQRAQKTQQASAKIQFEVNILSGQSTFLDISFQHVNDAKMGAYRIPFINENELCLQDLGFFNFEHFKKIEEYEGMYISKVRADAYLAYQNPFPSFHPNDEVIQSSLYQRIDLVKLCEKLTPGEYLELENVYFGRDAHFQARCIIFALDCHQKEKHLQKIDRRATKSGKVPKKVVRDLAGITIYMSNLPDWISARQIVELYRLRWQIELNFKVWKSYLEIDHFKIMKKERWLCHLYGTLLIYLISQLIAYQLRNLVWEENQIELSEMIAIRSMAKDVQGLYKKREGNQRGHFNSNKITD